MLCGDLKFVCMLNDQKKEFKVSLFYMRVGQQSRRFTLVQKQMAVKKNFDTQNEYIA